MTQRERLTLAVLLALAFALPGMPRASAASDPSPALLTGIAVGTDHSVSGVLTVQAAPGATSVDPGSLSVSVGGSRYPVRTVPITQERRAAMLVVDTSGSMGSAGMATVRSAAASFLQAIPPDVEVGLVAFSGDASVVVPLTRDRALIESGVAGLKSAGETAIFDAVALALTQLGTAGDRSILLLTDGSDNRSKVSKAECLAAVQAARVRAQVIGFKTGASDNLVLAEVAAAGQGAVVPAGDGGAVSRAFQSAAKALDSQVRWVVQAPDTLSGPQSIVISGAMGGRAFTTQAAIDLGPALRRPGAPATVAPPPVPAAPPLEALGAAAATALGQPVPLLVAGAATFAGLLGVVGALVAPLFASRRRTRVAAIEQYVSGRVVSGGRPSAPSPSAISESLVAFGEKVMKDRDSTSRTMTRLQRADLPWRAGEWWVLRVVALVVAAAGGMLLLGGNGLAPVGLLAGLLAGFFGPSVLLRFLAKRRARRFERQLPDVLTLVASSLSTGFSLLQALDAVAHDAAQPAAKEFSRTMAETRIGSDVDDALERMAARMDSNNMRWTAMAIRIQRQVGGNLAETLRTTAATLREREGLLRHVRALSAEGRLSAYILVALPICIFIYTLNTNYAYISLLWSNLLGWAMIAYGLVSMGVGVLWMRKVVEVEV